MVKNSPASPRVVLPAAIARGPHVESVAAMLDALRELAAAQFGVPLDNIVVEIKLSEPDGAISQTQSAQGSAQATARCAQVTLVDGVTSRSRRRYAALSAARSIAVRREAWTANPCPRRSVNKDRSSGLMSLHSGRVVELNALRHLRRYLHLARPGTGLRRAIARSIGLLSRIPKS
jgi:hypothetical protein